jgi:hypothetical protein
MNFIKENWFKLGLLAILVISIACTFYWYQVKPSNIRKECAWYLRGGDLKSGGLSELGKSMTVDEEKNYERCLRENGLER